MSTRCAIILPTIPLLALLLAAPLAAQGSNSCAAAPPIGVGITPYSTLAATTDGPPGCAQIGSDIWFIFAAPFDATWRFKMCANTDYDAALAIYPVAAPCPPASGNAIGCNDDACGPGLGPIVSLALSAGESVRLQVGGWSSAVGTGEIVIEELVPPPPGADILIGEISEFVQFGREGSEIGCGIQSVVCNAGADPLDWFQNPDPRHPFITSAAYRLEDDRFEQIGLSWAKHGFGAAQDDGCSLGCTPYQNNTRLGSGCSDAYGASTNAAQSLMGMRSEVDPFTGVYDYATSILSQGGGGFDGVERRLRIHDDDLDPLQHPGATWFCEVYVVAHDDIDPTNSIAWQPVVPIGAPGGTWDFDTSATSTLGSTIYAWPGALVVEIADPTATDGRVYFAAKATDLGGGSWRYEYAIHNLDFGAGIGSVSVPVADTVAVSGIGFHAPAQFEIGFDDQAWNSTRTADAVVWQTDAAGTATPQNPLRWGALYNFWFTASSPPQAASVTLGVHFAGGVPSLDAVTIGPEPGTPASAEFRRGDVNGDGLLDIADPVNDLGCLFACFPTCPDANDANDDGLWDIADPIYTLGYLFLFGAPPPSPGLVCGPDPTADALFCTSYAGCP
jgi:hypothetical protein